MLVGPHSDSITMTMELRFSHGAEACRSAAAERDLRHVAVVGFANIVEWELVRFVDALGNTEVIAQRPAPALWASDADTGPSGCVEDVMVQERAARGPRREVMAQHSLEQAVRASGGLQEETLRKHGPKVGVAHNVVGIDSAGLGFGRTSASPAPFEWRTPV